MISQKKILIIKIGKQRDEKSYEKLAKYKSKLLRFTVADNSIKLNHTLKENGNAETEVYDTDALAATMQSRKDLHLHEYDLVLGCLDRPHNSEDGILAEVSKDVERNKFYILCTTNIMERLHDGNVTLLNFLLNIIYGMYVRKYLGIDPEYHESPGCLLDYCYLERDLIAGCVKPELCEECASGVVNQETAAQLNRELKKIKMPLYIRLLEYVRQHTLMSMAIAVVTSILMEILASFFANKALGGSIIERVLTTIGPLMVLGILVVPFFEKKNR